MDDIKAFCTEIRTLMMQAQGPEWHDVDEQAWRELITLCKGISDRGRRFRGDGPGWDADAWKVFFFIRNHAFRPTWDKLTEFVRSTYGQMVMTGNEADVRRVVQAPAKAAIEAHQPAFSDTVPDWLDEFPSRDNGGAFDQILLRPLLHLSDYEARKACRIIRAENEKYAQEKAERAIKATRVVSQEQIRDRDRLQKTVAELKRRDATNGGNR
jgi:hypothetical protein